MKGGDLSPLRPSVDSMNQLIGQISMLLETQQPFVAEAAHELRAPLAVIGAQAHALQHAENEAERRENGTELDEGVVRATNVLRQLLPVARLAGAEPRFRRPPLDLGRLVRQRVAHLLPLARARSQDLGVEGPEHVPFEGDGPSLAIALDNLAEKAIRDTEPGGTLTVRLVIRGEEIHLEVEGTGPGMPPEFKPRAFERFSRGTTGGVPGSGLGLAIVQRVMALPGGRVA